MSRRPFLLGAFLLVLAFVGWFSFQVFGYYKQITAGTLSLADIPTNAFASSLTSTTAARQAAQSAPSGVDVVTKDDPSLGTSSATLTVVEFGDFQCPYSQEVNSAVRRLADKYSTQVRFIYRDFPLSDIHPNAEKAAEAADCVNAEAPSQYWAYHDKLFANQSDLSEDALVQDAAQLGLNTKTFQACLDAGTFADEVAADQKAGAAAGVYGTPSFFFNGHRIDGAIPEETFDKIIQAFLVQS